MARSTDKQRRAPIRWRDSTDGSSSGEFDMHHVAVFRAAGRTHWAIIGGIPRNYPESMVSGTTRRGMSQAKRNAGQALDRMRVFTEAA